MGSCRCKMCGGHIHYDDNASVATCEFCGTEQTIVKTDDQKKVTLFNRANSLRRENEFDKAQLTYDNILIDDPNNAEAHWGICLCRYGIEYVDTLDGKKIPTCHRTVIKSIFDDLDYKETISNADVVAKRVYEKEAQTIDNIQKDILAISQKEEAYDIFISYKEHDSSNNRSKDSIKAESIYNELLKKGYRVFFSRVSLKNIEVNTYEPIIFAALMSSKVMLSIGSCQEYFNATWEKNEWSRFISLMMEDHKKYLIPCFFDMDKKDIPEELLRFQAQDINGSLDELLKRIDKLFTVSEKVIVSTEQAVAREKAVSKISLENNLGRIGLFLKDGQFSKVNEYVEKSLNTDYTCALAYYYKMLSSLFCRSEDEVVKKRIVIKDNPNYEKAMQFADTNLKNKIEDLNRRIEEEILEYEKAELIKRINNLISSKKHLDALNMLDELDKYKNSENEKIAFKDGIYNYAVNKVSEKSLDEALSLFERLGDYRDSLSQIERINYIKKVEYETKKVDELSKHISLSFANMRRTKVYDDKRLNGLKEDIASLQSYTLCSYALEKYEIYKAEYDEIDALRQKSKFVTKVVVLSLIGVAIVALLIVIVASIL